MRTIEEVLLALLKREKPDELAVPDAPNMLWSMDFMAEHLQIRRRSH